MLIQSGLNFFMNLNQISSKIQISSQNQNNQPSIKNGSQIVLKVVSKISTDLYVVNVAGKNISVKSEFPLTTGQSLFSKVEIKNGNVVFRIIKKNSKINKLNILSMKDSSSLALFCEKNGIPATAESLKLLQFVLDMGIKFNSNRINKKLKEFSSFKNEKEKTEKSKISFLLEEKGILPINDFVEKISADNQNFRNKNSKEEQNQQKQIKIITKDEIKDYFNEVFSSSKNNKSGLLTLFNSLLPADKELNWIILPFEWNYKNFAGQIRILFDNKKNIQKIVIDCSNSLKKMIFVLYYIQNGKCKIDFGVNFEIEKGIYESLKNELINFLKSKEIYVPDENFSLCDYNTIDSFPCLEKKLFVFDGEA